MFSTISPDSGLWDSKTLINFLLSSILFNIETLEVGVSFSIKVDLINEDEIFFVYFGSISFPPHFFKH